MPRRKQQWSIVYERWEHRGYFSLIKDNKQSGFLKPEREVDSEGTPPPFRP